MFHVQTSKESLLFIQSRFLDFIPWWIHSGSIASFFTGYNVHCHIFPSWIPITTWLSMPPTGLFVIYSIYQHFQSLNMETNHKKLTIFLGKTHLFESILFKPPVTTAAYPNFPEEIPTRIPYRRLHRSSLRSSWGRHLRICWLYPMKYPRVGMKYPFSIPPNQWLHGIQWRFGWINIG